MSEENIFGENWMGLGWISLVMCVPFFVVHSVFEFDLKWMTGLPFVVFYYWSLVSAALLPILLVFQCVVIMKLWIKQKTILPLQVFLFLVVIGLFGLGAPGMWRGLFS